jgi:hypothetical protein
LLLRKTAWCGRGAPHGSCQFLTGKDPGSDRRPWSAPVNGNYWKYDDPTGDGTKLDVTYAIGGYLDGGLNQLAAAVDGVLTQQLTRLKNYVERGDPKAK